MKTRVRIEGIGMVGGFGTGVAAFRDALAGRPCPPVRVPGRPGDAPGDVSVLLADTAGLDRFAPPKELRRIDHYSQMALLGAHLAFEDAGVQAKDLKRLGLVIATGYGPSRSMFKFLDSILDDGIACASPSHFAASVHITASAYIAMKLGVDCADHVVSQFEMSVPSALMTACGWLEEGRMEHVLLGGVDEFGELLGYSWRRLFGTADAPPPGVVLGEGAAFLLLTRGIGRGGYAGVDEVEMGSLSARFPTPVAPGAVLLLGADGHGKHDSRYRGLVESGRDAACYTPLYGSLPVGFGFQLAAAALMVREGKIFATPGPPPTEGPIRMVARETDLGGRPVCCLLRGAGGTAALAVLSR